MLNLIILNWRSRQDIKIVRDLKKKNAPPPLFPTPCFSLGFRLHKGPVMNWFEGEVTNWSLLVESKLTFSLASAVCVCSYDYICILLGEAESSNLLQSF